MKRIRPGKLYNIITVLKFELHVMGIFSDFLGYN